MRDSHVAGLVRLFRRLQTPEGGLAPSAIARAFAERGELLCFNCRRGFRLGAQPALTFTPCPSCGQGNYVPYLVGGFVLLQPLGAGGISSVYKGCAASDPETPLAIKILQPDRVDDPEAIAAFALERNIHAHVPRHPNVVGFVASGEEEGEPYYAMEFVPGVRVEKWVQESGGLDEESALGVTAQLLAALRHILAAGFLYRDVNAGNLILKDNGEVVLIDFGLALPLDYDYVTNASRHVWGTGPFMPPERIRRAPEDERSVVYSVGMLLFFLLSGRTFFEEEELVEQARRHLSPIRLAVTGDILPGRSPQGAELVGQTIRARPEDRIQTLAELEERVLALLPEE